MLRKIRRYLRENKGQSIVEFALVLPVLLLVMTAIIDFGWVFAQYMAVEALARDSARFATLAPNVNQNLAQIQALTRNNAHTPIEEPADLTIAMNPVVVPRNRGDAITVTVAYPARSITGYLDGVIPGTLTAQVTMRQE